MKPRSIRLFDRVFFVEVVLGLLQPFITLDGLSDPQFAVVNVPGTEHLVWIALDLIVGITLWYQISRKANSWARTVFILFSLITMALSGWLAFENSGIVPLDACLLAFLAALQAVEVALLTRGDTGRWLSSQRLADA